MNNDMKLYYDYTVSPLGKLFYKTVWEQMSYIKDKSILDFGSGFGFTSNYLANNNKVVSVEKDKSMIEGGIKDKNYTCINSDLREVESMADNIFDVVVCHLVLEFVENPQLILSELVRVLKKGGTLSIVKHNKNGRIIQSIVQNYDIKYAMNLLEGGFSFSSAFGDIKYYENEELLKWTGESVFIKEIYGVRAVASLHNSDIQSSENWLLNMFEIEKKLCKNKDYIPIAYFNHILLQKK